ncbi:MAG: alpha,alpha-trehalase TreF [Bacteroidota bacterium]
MLRRFFLPALMIAIGLVACKPTDTSSSSKRQGPQDLYPVLFDAVQMAGIFPDSKTFVDYIPKRSPQEIENAYLSLKDSTAVDLMAFVNENFDPPRVFKPDFTTDTSMAVADHLERLWPVLTRQPDTLTRGSLISLPEPYIVPGGRFREVYYWDSYFTMLGLQVSDNAQPMVRHMVNNFAHIINEVGFIPNGNRTYYLTRSQPPFFSLMVRLLAEMEGDSVLAEYLNPMELEYLFWMDGTGMLHPNRPTYKHLVQMPDGELLNRYWDAGTTPRPESYREDVELAEAAGGAAEDVYLDIRAAAASGWDFSTRWFADGANMSTIRTTDIIPPDLNALLYHLELLLVKAHTQAGHTAKATLYEQKAASRKAALLKYLWDAKQQYFVDYDWKLREATNIPSLAMMFPLYFEMADQSQADAIAKRIETDFLQPGGVVSTLNRSGQQWDSPNGWAPLQWITIQGLRNYGHDELAQEIADRWVALNTRTFRNSGRMLEKYNVIDMDLTGGGGEYPTQDGFGWTNGVMLRLLKGE